MRGTSKDWDTPRAPRPRLRLVGLLSLLALIVGSSRGILGTAAAAAPKAEPAPTEKLHVSRLQGLRDSSPVRSVEAHPRRNGRMRTLVLGLTFIGVAVIGVAASAKQDHVTICHATGSKSNPFVQIAPSVNGVFHGHLHHGNDIIPPFEFGGQTYSLNWDAEGQAIWRNSCEAPGPPSEGGPPNVLPSVVVTPPPFTG